MIELNMTLLMQVIGFFILLFVLNGLLYKPVLSILKQREERIDGAKKEAEQLFKEVQARTDDYEKRLHEAKVKGQEERLKLRQVGLEKEKLILDAARKEAQESVSGAKKRLEGEIKSVMTRLSDDSGVIARDIAEKIVGRKVA